MSIILRTELKIGTFLVIATLMAGCAQKNEATPGPAEKTTPSTTAAAAPMESTASQAPSSMPAIDACAVLTRDEVEKLFGALKEGPSPATGVSGEKQCKYSNMNGSWMQVSLSGTERWDFQKQMLPGSPKALPGLGDEALSLKRGTDSVVYVRKGGGLLEISCSCAMTEAEALAQVAAVRL